MSAECSYEMVTRAHNIVSSISLQFPYFSLFSNPFAKDLAPPLNANARWKERREELVAYRIFEVLDSPDAFPGVGVEIREVDSKLRAVESVDMEEEGEKLVRLPGRRCAHQFCFRFSEDGFELFEALPHLGRRRLLLLQRFSALALLRSSSAAFWEHSHSVKSRIVAQTLFTARITKSKLCL
ncbi:hypothetical protein ACLOJK_016794 [Asimina triloba]